MNAQKFSVFGLAFFLLGALIWGNSECLNPLPASAQEAESVEEVPFFKADDMIPMPLRRETFQMVWETIRDKYFDPDFGGKDWNTIGESYRLKAEEAQTSRKFHAILGEMLKELGRSHLAVIAPNQQTRERKVPVEPLMFPEGLELRIAEDRVVVYSVELDSSAYGAGLRPGQVLEKAREKDFSDSQKIRASRFQTLIDAKGAVAGSSETAVLLTVIEDKNNRRTLEVPRDAPFKARAHLGRAVVKSERIHPKVGYIWFDGWSFDLKSKLEPVVKEYWDTEGLIIDIRQNRGGVNPGVDYLAHLLCKESGSLAVEVTRSGITRNWSFEGSGDAAYKGKVAILIDEASGSASEVFASGLQELGRAVILGRPSYGGVLNSTQEKLRTGGILQYPHSDMRTPKGIRIEGVGVQPDIPVDMQIDDLIEGNDTVIQRALCIILDYK